MNDNRLGVVKIVAICSMPISTEDDEHPPHDHDESGSISEVQIRE